MVSLSVFVCSNLCFWNRISLIPSQPLTFCVAEDHIELPNLLFGLQTCANTSSSFSAGEQSQDFTHAKQVCSQVSYILRPGLKISIFKF